MGGGADAEARIPDKGYKKTAEAFSRVACEDEALFAYKKDLIRSLDYTKKRALRAFSRIDSITAEELVASLERLVFAKISFDNMQLLERFVTLEGATAELAWTFLERLARLGYSKGRVMTGFILVDVVPADELLRHLDRIEKMSEPAAWGLKAFLLLPGHEREDIVAAMGILEKMNSQQQWAVEQCCRIKGINAYHALEIIRGLLPLSRTDAWNAKGLFKQDISVADAKSWVKWGQVSEFLLSTTMIPYDAYHWQNSKGCAERIVRNAFQSMLASESEMLWSLWRLKIETRLVSI